MKGELFVVVGLRGLLNFELVGLISVAIKEEYGFGCGIVDSDYLGSLHKTELYFFDKHFLSQDKIQQMKLLLQSYLIVFVAVFLIF